MLIISPFIVQYIHFNSKGYTYNNNFFVAISNPSTGFILYRLSNEKNDENKTFFDNQSSKKADTM